MKSTLEEHRQIQADLKASGLKALSAWNKGGGFWIEGRGWVSDMEAKRILTGGVISPVDSTIEVDLDDEAAFTSGITSGMDAVIRGIK